jgi:hypothetical protein
VRTERLCRQGVPPATVKWDWMDVKRGVLDRARVERRAAQLKYWESVTRQHLLLLHLHVTEVAGSIARSGEARD